MKGTILDFEPNSKEGVICADNKRFTFNMGEWKYNHSARPGQHVEFAAHLGKAKDIKALYKAPNAIVLASETINAVKRSKSAVASLIFGILSLIFISSLLAIIFGHVAQSRIRHSHGKLIGSKMARWGLFLGYIGLLLNIVFFIILAAQTGPGY
ncbi:DUF4190 domain-containing protein [Aliiglaciecola sp. 3_MG-2023]|uniref:DUF4190 domain-containing protein n=1 Tax=Aliiglaciecola sp. 3_MG-2023 TaxID=3062644 RepID=UPI0026E139C3|nr:DUF4190 domain-containing protein [Aliiglaciecola sp. 3_MG-2023]MDO6692878.1 DUF4190 domain-containing protein [Aliiglaciecola sp. 3_MG-2023]